MGGYPPPAALKTSGDSVSPWCRSTRRSIASLLALVLAAALGACSIEQSLPDTPTPTHAVGQSETTVAPTTSAPRQAAAKPGEARGSPVTLAFGGDVHFEGVIRSRLTGNPATTFGPIASVLRRADLAMVNLETAITTRGTPQAKSFTFRAPASAFQALKGAGVDVATMANNHGMDYGQVGLEDSIEAAADADLPVVGIGRNADEAYRPYRVTIHGQRIAIIGATQVLDDSLAAAWTAGDGKPGLASAYQVDRLLEAVRSARRVADTVIVDLHWGKELTHCPIDRQRTLAPKLVKAGADVIVGSHAHVLLGGGYLGPAYVDYGLGNFVFYASGGEAARSGVLTLTVRGRAVTRSSWTPAVISGGIPIPIDGSAADQAAASWNDLRGCTGLAAEPSVSNP
jgi:poly-gamma-glutamate capsule biosynthesis protein CapA/YwtB (metallophosphatase superfamily)